MTALGWTVSISPWQVIAGVAVVVCVLGIAVAATALAAWPQGQGAPDAASGCPFGDSCPCHLGAEHDSRPKAGAGS